MPRAAEEADDAIGALVILGFAATAVVLAFFAVDTLRNAPETFVAIVVITVLAVAFDVVWKRSRGPLDPAAEHAEAPASS